MSISMSMSMSRLIVILLFGTLLTGCAGLTPVNTSPDELQQNLPDNDQDKLNALLNTTKDNHTETWQSADGDIRYEFTARNTHVNARGLPCRAYVLLVDRDYHRKQTTTADVCRGADGTWQTGSNASSNS